MRNGNLLKSRVSEIRVKRIRVNQGVGVITKGSHPSSRSKRRNKAQTGGQIVLIQQNIWFLKAIFKMSRAKSISFNGLLTSNNVMKILFLRINNFQKVSFVYIPFDQRI